MQRLTRRANRSAATTAEVDRPREDLLASLGTRLKTLRSRQGWTLKQLSKRTKMSVPYLSRLEGGTRQPSLAALVTLGQAYKIPLYALLDTTGDVSNATRSGGGL